MNETVGKIFTVGQKLQFRTKDRLVQGYYLGTNRKGHRIEDKDKGTVWAIPFAYYNLLQDAIFEGEVKINMVKFKKGDFVEFDNKGTLIKGIVQKVGATNYKVSQFLDPDLVWTIPLTFGSLKASSFKLPKDEPSVMDDYEVRKCEPPPPKGGGF